MSYAVRPQLLPLRRSAGQYFREAIYLADLTDELGYTTSVSATNMVRIALAGPEAARS
jgi:hypothetical protein